MGVINGAFAATLSDTERKNARRDSILSTFAGCVSEVLIDKNTVVVLYLLALGGSDSFTMSLTALTGLCYMLISIPCAGLANRIGLKATYTLACYLGCGSMLLMASAPYFGDKAAPYIAMAGCFGYCLSRPPYVATWYPMCNSFLRPEERGNFFGRMRFSYMIFNTLVLFSIGKMLKYTSSVWVYQIVIALSGLALLIRKYYLDKLPRDPRLEHQPYDLWAALKKSLGNPQLKLFSTYLVLLAVPSMAVAPLAVLFMKEELGFPAPVLMYITTAGLIGSISGYGVFGKLLASWRLARLRRMTHLLFIIVAAGFFLLRPNIVGAPYWAAAFYFIDRVADAWLLCCVSISQMYLPRPGNEVMAMAFISTCQQAGGASGRFLVSSLIAGGVLLSQISIGSWSFSHARLIFFGCIVMLVFAFGFLLRFCNQEQEEQGRWQGEPGHGHAH